MKKTHLTQTRFSNLELSDSILRGLNDAGFKHCTPIQDRTLPLSLRGKDIAGQAQTGTGKTATFLLATFQHLINDESEKIKNPRAIIIAPTRELAIQIHKDALALSKHLDLHFALVYGGTDYKKQLGQVKSNPDIIIGTPGRIIDFYKQNAFTLDNIQVTVLDEADRMFDLGFIKDIRFLLRRMPPANKRLNLLFSATLSYKVTELAYEHMNNPVLVRIESEEVTSKDIKQLAYCPANEQKIPLLLGILAQEKPQRSFIFVNTKKCAERVNACLNANGYKTALLSGDVPQEKRQALLSAFQENKVSIMIATDVAARGLHIADVSHVINYDIPQDVEDYVHRIGRTARFGATGTAISFICEDYAYSMPDIEDFIEQKIPVLPITAELLVEAKKPTSRSKAKPVKTAADKKKSTGKPKPAKETIAEAAIETEVKTEAPVEPETTANNAAEAEQRAENQSTPEPVNESETCSDTEPVIETEQVEAKQAEADNAEQDSESVQPVLETEKTSQEAAHQDQETTTDLTETIASVNAEPASMPEHDDKAVSTPETAATATEAMTPVEEPAETEAKPKAAAPEAVDETETAIETAKSAENPQ